MPDDFSGRIYEAVKMIPPGRVSSYSELASYVSTASHARAAALVLKKNPSAPYIPCHRIVRKDSSLGGYTPSGGVSRKEELLRGEGLKIVNGRVEDFDKVFYRFPVKNKG